MAYYLAGLADRGQNRLDDSQRDFDRALQLQPHAFDVLEAKFNYRSDPNLKDKDPGTFNVYAVPLSAQ